MQAARAAASLAARLATGAGILAGASAGAGLLLWGLLWWPVSSRLVSLAGAAVTFVLVLGPSAILALFYLGLRDLQALPDRLADRTSRTIEQSAEAAAAVASGPSASGLFGRLWGDRETDLGPPRRSFGEPGPPGPLRRADPIRKSGLPAPGRGGRRRHGTARAGRPARTSRGRACVGATSLTRPRTGGTTTCAPDLHNLLTNPPVPMSSSGSSADLLRVLVSVFLPPLGVFLQEGIGTQFWINLLLTLMGYLPGLVHAIWIIARR